MKPNEDHCSSCRTVASGGGLVYCDSCPRAFHFVCLDPPINPAEVGDGDWFCPSCVIRQVRLVYRRTIKRSTITFFQNPTPKPIRSFMAPLIQQVQSTFPVEFHLPDDIRGFFRDGELHIGLLGELIIDRFPHNSWLGSARNLLGHLSN